jgi:histidinol-phosphate aminotransferase
VKYPYNVNKLTQDCAMEELKDVTKIHQRIVQIKDARTTLMQAFSELPICQKVYPTDANFFLTRVTDANAIYDYLVHRGIIVRNRNRVTLCGNCLRITIGTKDENTRLLSALRQYR